MTEQQFFALIAPSYPATWALSHKGSAALRALADRHYTRQQAGTSQFCRPGVNLCLLLDDGTAGWVVWRPIPEVGRMDLLEAWECTLFRNEGARLSSDLIREATATTYRMWGWPPRDGLITAVGIAQTSRRRSKSSPPGRCFIEAGWTPMQRVSEGKAWFLAPRPTKVSRTEGSAK